MRDLTLLAVQARRALGQGDLEAFLDLLAEDLPGLPGNATRKNYLSSLRAYLRWATAERRSILNAQAEDAEAYLTFLIARHAHAPATIHNHLTRVRTLYDVLHAPGLHAGPNPFLGLRLPSNKPEEHRDLYSEEELARLLAHADAQGRALVLVGAHAGLTGPETVRLRWEDLDTQGGRLRVGAREVEASEELHRALRAYGQERGHTDLFGATGKAFDPTTDHELRAVIYALCRAANVPYRAWRALRNSAGLRLLRLTGDPRIVADRLGLTTLKAVEPLQKLDRAGTAVAPANDRSEHGAE
ncbi:phage integrase-like protein SAM-like protein [Deinococcus phoenicis]|uniref:Phage integrase-like protein SAM-like protein n=1 Tax=Deinococcus phoenicis TaxID=1476583 RepID=A0A016QT37_9DEIO|nr:phage integrase N-terminal SAM-like domain-containing protein [Deinococcus phoenicis]EYB69290.1 phage integrase-like protein SAM-like protein [Deinococcus phoenicis]